MYSKILVPMALDHDISPLTLAIANALRGLQGEIIALHVHEAPQGSVSVYLDDETVKAGLDTAKAMLAEKNRCVFKRDTRAGHWSFIPQYHRLRQQQWRRLHRHRLS